MEATKRQLIIGISGKKGSGKTTVCNIIKARYPDFVVYNWADPLKPAVKILFNWEHLDLVDGPDKETVDERWGVSPRAVLQHLGTDYLRTVYCDDFFVRNLKHRLAGSRPDRILIGDVRFPNEIDFIKSQGVVWRIERPGQVYTDQHASETALDGYTDWDRLFVNDGSLEELKATVLAELAKLLGD